uniref:Uncharacterized protein n=1 Tax=Arundo donax TaxID=35708 RepID=A0A0A9B9E5_ARUDO
MGNQMHLYMCSYTCSSVLSLLHLFSNPLLGTSVRVSTMN